MIIFFIGFMGSGKSHEANKLATALSISCFDLDNEIEKIQGKSITFIFEEDGEARFREIERDALRQLVDNIENTSVKNAVIACGGGTPCFHDNMSFMNANGVTIWLNPPIETLVSRLRSETAHRPLVKTMEGKSLENFIAQKLQERNQYYQQAQLEIQEPEIDTSHLINLINHAKELS